MAGRKSSFYRKARRAIALVALVLIALPAVPAQAGITFFSWSTRPVRFMKDGTAYFMTMSVTESGGNSANLTVRITKSRNPAGVARSTQQHFWSFPISPDSVSFNRNNLSSASVDTGDQLGDFGSIDLNFAEDGRLATSCRGNIKQRDGRMTGSFDFNTNTDFGTVTKRPARGTLFFHNGANCGGGGGGNRCPKQSRSVGGSRVAPNSMGLAAARDNGANSASVGVSYFESIAEPPGTFAFHSISAVVPSGNVVVASDLASATVMGAGGTWISGTANFVQTGDTTASQPTNCRNGKEWLRQSRPGTISGDLMADFFLGPDRSLSDGGKTGNASKVIVRPR